MKIKNIKLRNIRSYENAEVNFPSGSTLLSGDIGSGKTSVLLAIEFALFGLQPGQKGASLLRASEKEGSVSLELEVDGKSIIIERTLKRGKSISQEDAAIIIDGDRRELSVTELKNLVLSILNYPPEFAKKTNLLYRFTVYTPQEEMKQIILENPDDRLDTLRHVFGIDKYKRIKENAELFRVKLRSEIRNRQGMIQDLEDKNNLKIARQNSLIKLNSDLIISEQEFIQSKDKRKQIELEIDQVQKKIDEKRKLENEIEKTKALLAGKKEMSSSLIREEERINQQSEEARKIIFDDRELAFLEKEKSISKDREELTNKQYLEILSQINSLNLKNQDSDKQKSNIAKLQHCPTCLQDVNTVYKANIINKFDKEISQNKSKIQELTEEKAKFLLDLEAVKKRNLDIEKRTSELRILKVRIENLKEKISRIEEIKKQRLNLEKDFEMLNQHVESLKSGILELSVYDSIYQKSSQELRDAFRKEKDAEIKKEKIMKEIELTKKEIELISLEILRKEEIKKQLNYMAELEDWISTQFLELVSFTEKNVMLKLKEEFSKLFNEWFNVLVPDIFSVHLDDSFTPVIEQKDFELDYNFLSGGERTAIALAYRLALNQTINSLLSKIKTRDIVILDEPTDGFSEQQLDKMRDVLSQLKVSQLILVSHESKIESFVENMIKFKKEAGITRVEN
jgi:DNA repair protein SbcC/Rad50